MAKEDVLKKIESIREKIYDAFKGIKFIEESHRYFVEGDGEYSPVSNVIKNFFNEFDTESQAERYAIKNGLIKEDVIKSWKYTNLCSTISGTRTHLYGEGYTWLISGINENIPKELLPQYVKEYNWLIPTSPKECGVKKFYDELPNCIYPIGAEFKMSSQYMDIKTKMCGTADLLLYYDNQEDDSKSGVILSDWKGLSVNTPILTEKGWTTMGEIQEGDIVFDKDGNKTLVIHTSQVHNNECYEINFKQGMNIIADKEHRWLIDDGNVYTTEQLHEKLNTNGEELYIENSKPIHDASTNNELPIHPFILGIWLSFSLNYKNGDMYFVPIEIEKKIKKLGYNTITYYNSNKKGNVLFKITIEGLEEKLKENNLLFNPHIPYCYLITNSMKDKRMLLDGILSNKFLSHKTKDKVKFKTNEKGDSILMYSLRTLLGSMGIFHYLGKVDGYKCIVFDYSEEDDVKDKIHRYQIESIEKCETVNTRCIEVDSPSHTYLYGYDLLVTHNTNKTLTNSYNRSNNVMMLPPFDDMIDEALNHYALQFACYQLMLESIGIPIIGRRLIFLVDNDYQVFKIKNLTEKMLSQL